MKRTVLILAAILTLSTMTACKASGSGNADNEIELEEVTKNASVFIVDIDNDGNITAEAETAEAGTEENSHITVKEGAVLTVASALSSGKVEVKIKASGSTDNTPPAVQWEFEGIGETEYTLIESGEYDVFFKVTETADGTVRVFGKRSE
ncbi:MAG: hypothetical protein IJL89_09345 [Firmicutes bacterium]|nr:hypothetical protein [Bacillota bacterium]